MHNAFLPVKLIMRSVIPINAPVVLFGVKVEGYAGDEEDKSHATKGMRIEAVAIIQ